MKHYVMLFRATRALTPEELKQRPVDIRNWIQHVNSLGIKLDPRNLEEPATQFTLKDGEVVSSKAIADPSLVTMVFFDAFDKQQALEVARLHPAPHYGVSLELREWNPPQVPLATQQ